MENRQIRNTLSNVASSDATNSNEVGLNGFSHNEIKGEINEKEISRSFRKIIS